MIENKQINPIYVEKSIIVDLNNVLLDDKDAEGKAKLQNIDLINEVLRSHGYTKIILITSSKFIERVNNRNTYKKMVKERKIHVAPALDDNDWYILELAKDLDCDVLSNDKYNDYWVEFGEDWVKKKRKTFMLIEGKLIIKM